VQSFVDETILELSSGHGGPGAVSFRREKYIPYDDPDGGDGGKGGSVVFVVKNNLKTLTHLKMKRHYKGENGRQGEGSRRHGRDGADVFIPVPPGTIIKDTETGTVYRELLEADEEWIFLKGGIGGKGNWHFSTSVKQAPRYAQPGKEGEQKTVIVELNMVADIGFVGFPNAGKSSLLAAFTNAHPKIAAYPFTTKIPNLGMLHVYDQDIILADIPGLIEGASHGAGLGIRFLKHIARTKCLAFLIDLGSENYLDAFDILMTELGTYGHGLTEKKRVVIGTKMDEEGSDERLELLKARLSGETVQGLSVFSQYGIPEIKKIFFDLAAEK
jgi:GTP-binding protein